MSEPLRRALRSTMRRIGRHLPGVATYDRMLFAEHRNNEALAAHADALAARLHVAEHALPGPIKAQVGKLSADAPLWQSAGHFYSPIVDVQHIIQRQPDVFDRSPTHLPGIDARVDAQWHTFEQLVPLMADLDLCTTPQQATERGRRYYIDNPAYADGDASLLAGMLRWLRPQRLVELGCGYSSACTLDTRDHHLHGAPHITFVDPYPQLLETLLRPSDHGTVDILPVGTQQVPLAVIDTLDANDVLFIDSTHVSKTGSDVNHIFFELLPRLKSGVVVHVHDVFASFEYPRSWVEEGRSWNELYTLRAFLQFNDAFEILIFPGMLQAIDRDRYFAGIPGLQNPGGAFWMRRR